MKRIVSFWFLLSLSFASLPGCSDPCEDTSCINGGVCFDGDCDCPIGFTGVDCRSETREDFLGTYQLVGQCEEDSASFILISRNPNRGDYLYIDNLGDEGIRVNAIVSGNEFQIDEQSFLEGTITGFGSYNNDQLLMNYTFTNDSLNSICSATGIKL